MALESVVFQQDPYSSFFLLERSFSYEIFDHLHQTTMSHSTSSSTQVLAAAAAEKNFSGGRGEGITPTRKRRRTRSEENMREDKEKQRMTHIAVERKRRRQMNDHLSVLKSMIPSSYAQRGDQASIVGGVINFLKELEQVLHSLEAQKSIKTEQSLDKNPKSSSIFSDFFISPQFSTIISTASSTNHCLDHLEQPSQAMVADVEVTIIESYANIKVLSKAHKPSHLSKMVSELCSLGLSILHLNLTTCKHMVLYSLSVKVEETSQLTSSNKIATAVQELVRRIQEEN